jgi:hypothetical protein
MVMSIENSFSGITFQMAKALGKYQGFAQFLKEGNDTMTKEQIIARLIEIDEEFEANVKKKS